MIDKRIIGTVTGPFEIMLERGRVAFYAKVLGFEDPVYTDLAAARKQGYPDLLVPPTFLFGLEIETGSIYSMFAKAGIDLGEVLHGEEEFTYHKPLFAGDTVKLETRVTDVYEKKNGKLEFVVMQTIATRDGEKVLEMKNVTAVNHQ